MTTPFDTVREALTATRALLNAKAPVSWQCASAQCGLALTALTQIEADHAHDLATAAASGFRDGVASVQPALNRFHHLMHDHGLHPGRTDDDLLEILDAHLTKVASVAGQQPAVPEGYALIGIDALKAWGVYDQVRDACQYPVAQQPQAEAVPSDVVCNKDPRGCWNVRCQLGKVCKNAAMAQGAKK